jgi:hypothetical protein
MARKSASASDLAEIIGEATENLGKAARREARQDCATALDDMIKDPRQFESYLTTSSETLPSGTVITYKSYLPGEDPTKFEATPEFVKGLKFAIALLRNEDHEF